MTDAGFAVSAQCHRVNVSDGHLAAVRVKFSQKVAPAEVREALQTFTSLPQELGLHSAPDRPIIVRDEKDRPQPRLDRHAGRGMSVTVGRIAEDRVLDCRFVALSHNTIRGAAGAAILNAEMLLATEHLRRDRRGYPPVSFVERLCGDVCVARGRLYYVCSTALSGSCCRQALPLKGGTTNNKSGAVRTLGLFVRCARDRRQVSASARKASWPCDDTNLVAHFDAAPLIRSTVRARHQREKPSRRCRNQKHVRPDFCSASLSDT